MCHFFRGDIVLHLYVGESGDNASYLPASPIFVIFKARFPPRR